jgi:Holliday junction resolvase
MHGIERESTMAVNQYRYGREKERKVAQLLRRKGAHVEFAAASKGAADLVVKFSTGTRWHIQVKSSRSDAAAGPSTKDLGRLKQSATKNNATAVVAKVTPKGIVYESARTGRKLAPPARKRS